MLWSAGPLIGLRYYQAPRMQHGNSPGPLGAAVMVQVPDEFEELWTTLSSSARHQIAEVARQLRRP